MSEYRAIYKCRLCGEEFEDAIMGRDIAYMGAAVLTVKNHFEPEGCAIGIHRHNVHHCNNGSYGFADFLGAEKWGMEMNLIEKWKNRETKKKLREENIRLKDRLKCGYMNVVTLDKMSLSKIQDLPRDTIVFYVEESTEEEYWEIMKLTYDKLIGVLKVSEAQIRHIRRIMVEHPVWYGNGFERIS